MRTIKNYKIHLLLFVILYIFSLSSLFAYYESDENNSAFFNIETLSYAPVDINTETQYTTGAFKSNVKAIELVQLSNKTTSTESYKAIPHINIENYTATLSNDTQSTTCRLLVKSSVTYNNLGTVVAWFEIDDVKTYIYIRKNLNQTAYNPNPDIYDFTLTLYYIIDNPETILTSANTSSQYLSLNTGGTTNYYLFYIENNVTEIVFFNSTLTGSIVTPTTPEFDPEPTSFLYMNARRPNDWTQTKFFDDLGEKHLAWIVSLQAGVATPTNNTYKIGLTISSANNFVLICDGPGSGIKQVPYTLLLSKKNDKDNQTINVYEGDKILIENIRDNIPREFYIYARANNINTSLLNAGRYTDTIYLNFVTDVDTPPKFIKDKSIQVF
ncbi:MAG: hypothetical protein EOL97_14275 [Spirochaetia bacterium]|nr:hypothetical protein [Spirochaetia bacterium]